MSIPLARDPAPSLAPSLAVLGIAGAAHALILNWIRVESWTSYWPRGLQYWTLVSLAGQALTIGALAAAAVAAVALVRARRSPGAALAAAALVASVVSAAAMLYAYWLHPVFDALHGWRYEVLVLVDWAGFAQAVLIVVGLAAAAWDDRSVRGFAPVALGAAIASSPPPPLSRWAKTYVERDATTVDGGLMIIDESRLWIVPGLVGAAAVTWGLTTAWLAHCQRRVPVDAMAPRPPALALRAFVISLLVMAAVAIVAGLAIAVVQGWRHDETGILPLLIPVAVGAAALLVAAALLAITMTDVPAAAARRFGGAAILVLWCVAVVAAQTLSSRRPYPQGTRFTIFDAPWMPGMVGAVVAVAALLLIAGGLAACARDAGRPPGRLQGVIVVLALVIGAATVPWLLGFGTRAIPLDGLRIATLASAALVNLAAWFALARAAWRTAAAYRSA